MKRAVAWFAENPVAANLMMLVIVVGGLTTLPRVPQKMFPDIDIEMISVTVVYLGAAPEEVEAGVCVRIEEEIDGVDGIEKVRSTSVEGACTVIIELVTGAENAKVLADVKNRVDAITTFPEETEKPIISEITIRRAVIDVAIQGRADEKGLRAVGRRVRDEIAALPGVSQVDLDFERPFEISIEISEESLRRFGVTFDQVARAVRASSLDLPGGTLKTPGGEILLRTKGQAYRGAEFEDIVVLTRRDGTRVTLADVATIVDGFEDLDMNARFDGEPALLIHVYRMGDQDSIEISDQVHAYVAEAQMRLPEGIALTVWQDSTESLRGRIDTLLRNARSGFLLVLLTLALFLRPRLAFWVTLGVPISFLGGLWMFSPLHLSIDVASLFAFIVVLGILVDDAIVVGESAYTHQQKLGDRLRGAIAGTQEVTVPVVFGVLTTVAAFVPLTMVEGPMGQMFAIMGTVVIACLLFSLVESQLILPAHLAHGQDEPHQESRRAAVRAVQRVQEALSEGMVRFSRERYRPFLERALEWRYASVATALALLFLTLGLIASGRMAFSFFPPIEADYLSARLTMPQGTPLAVTREAAAHIERSVAELRAQLDPEYAEADGSLVRHVLTGIGKHPFKELMSQGPGNFSGSGGGGGSHLAEVTVELVPSEQRAISTRQVGRVWREIVGPIPGAVELLFASDMFTPGLPIDIQLQGADIDELRRAAEEVKAELAQYPGVLDIADSFRAGKQEMKLAILDSAEPLGLTLQDLARQVRQAFYGEEAQRIQRGPDDVRVMVRYPEGQRRSLGDLENARIRTPDGTEVPFATVAAAELGRGFATIRRTDRKRVVNVTADVDSGLTTGNEVLASLQAGALPGILADHPSVTYALEGVQREQSRAFGDLMSSYIVALLAIYTLLAIPLRSYAQPLIIMSVIPFGLVGAIAGHLLTGRSLSFMSVIGIVALSGVVVNASLVLVHRVNARRRDGDSVGEAVCEAGLTRFRPIVLTSLTTFVGLTPILLERSMQAQFLIPMATSLAFGVLFSTGITLIVVPCGYLILEDLRGLVSRERRPRMASARPPRTA